MKKGVILLANKIRNYILTEEAKGNIPVVNEELIDRFTKELIKDDKEGNQ
jgi:hypothetical protein